MALIDAYEQWVHERVEARKSQVRTDEEARALADTPHLTGDPEWDEIELQETATDNPWWRQEAD